MKGYVINIGKTAEENNNFRKVLYTARYSQLVVMSLRPGEDIGEEVHDLDQFLRVEHGEGKAVLNGVEYLLQSGSAIMVPAGTNHNIINTAPDKAMKLYTIYSPPNHRNGVIHNSKEDATLDNEHFDGKTTE